MYRKNSIWIFDKLVCKNCSKEKITIKNLSLIKISILNKIVSILKPYLPTKVKYIIKLINKYSLIIAQKIIKLSFILISINMELLMISSIWLNFKINLPRAELDKKYFWRIYATIKANKFYNNTIKNPNHLKN